MNSIACDACKYKEDCNLLNKFINDIKDKGLSPDQYVRGLALFVYVLKEQKYLNDFGKIQEDIIKLATEDGFELDWLINRWDSSIISLADDGGIELRNYDIVIIRFNF